MVPLSVVRGPVQRGRAGPVASPPGSSQHVAMGLDETAIEGLRRMILAGGVQQLSIGDLRADEVAGLTGSGNPAHLRSVAATLDRAAQGLEDYLMVRAHISPREVPRRW